MSVYLTSKSEYRLLTTTRDTDRQQSKDTRAMADQTYPAHIRIVIADDHPLFRDGLRTLLESDPQFAVIGEAGDAISAVNAVRTRVAVFYGSLAVVVVLVGLALGAGRRSGTTA